MSLKDTPRIKLESAESLPDWMREAEAEDDASNEALENIGEQDSKIKEKLCVRLVSKDFYLDVVFNLEK